MRGAEVRGLGDLHQPLAVRLEQPVEHGRLLAVADQRARLAQQRDRGEPEHVARDRRELVPRQLAELRHAGLRVAGHQVRHRQDRAPGEQPRVLLDEPLDRLRVVAQRVLAPAQDQHLGGVDRLGVARLRLAAELVGLAREPLGVADAARHLRPHDLPADREVVVERLAQLGGERRQPAVGAPGGVDLRRLEQVVDPPVVAERLQLGLADPRRQPEQLLARG